MQPALVRGQQKSPPPHPPPKPLTYEEVLGRLLPPRIGAHPRLGTTNLHNIAAIHATQCIMLPRSSNFHAPHKISFCHHGCTMSGTLVIWDDISPWSAQLRQVTTAPHLVLSVAAKFRITGKPLEIHIQCLAHTACTVLRERQDALCVFFSTFPPKRMLLVELHHR